MNPSEIVARRKLQTLVITLFLAITVVIVYRMNQVSHELLASEWVVMLNYLVAAFAAGGFAWFIHGLKKFERDREQPQLATVIQFERS